MIVHVRPKVNVIYLQTVVANRSGLLFIFIIYMYSHFSSLFKWYYL